MLAFLAWAAINTAFVLQGWATLPGVALALGFMGAAAVVTVGVMLSKTRLAEPIRYAGENSIVIYLAFFLFMASTRAVLLRLVPDLDLGVVSLIVTAGARHRSRALVLDGAQDAAGLPVPPPALGKAGFARTPVA